MKLLSLQHKTKLKDDKLKEKNRQASEISYAEYPTIFDFRLSSKFFQRYSSLGLQILHINIFISRMSDQRRQS